MYCLNAALVNRMAVSALARFKLRRHAELAPMRTALLDLFSLVDARYLLGASDDGSPRHMGVGR